MNFNLKVCLWLLVKLLLIAHLSFPINLFLPWIFRILFIELDVFEGNERSM